MGALRKFISGSIGGILSLLKLRTICRVQYSGKGATGRCLAKRADVYLRQ